MEHGANLSLDRMEEIARSLAPASLGVAPLTM
jgi:hypothetical protein